LKTYSTNILVNRAVKLVKPKFTISFLFMFLGLTFSCAQKNTSPVVHDPVLIQQENGTFNLFCTGWGITMMTSPNLIDWKIEKPVFNKPPAWTQNEVTDFKGHFWAPDISFFKGTYYLFYSVSSFAKNTSCIGLVTNKTLDPKSADYNWEDKGLVVQSVPGRDMWNAIDPNLIRDDSNTSWLVFGSFWNGIKLVKLDSSLTAIAKTPEEWYTLATRPRSFELDDKDPGDGAIEAPFIFKSGGYYYLFVSFDYCCRGIKSTYKIMVGRSKDVVGPYIDKEGKRMDKGGGSLVLEGNADWPGVGHNAVCTINSKDFLVFHAYDASDDGKPKLKIIEIKWDPLGWPVVELN